jgi:hypothetical protein
MPGTNAASRSSGPRHQNRPSPSHALNHFANATLAHLETCDLDDLRREHVQHHGVAWETAQAWLADYRRKRYVRVGETITHEVAYSEVAMHMRVAGTEMAMRPQSGGRGA